ncbi:hypothetical protein [Macrococcus animalis]|uniref:hypothetical protein n=1 Tax=Macrococcus animalis TaxID=3395467 RepID=UPI0039BE3D16
MVKIENAINILIVIFFLVLLLHIPNNIFDWNMKVEIRTVQIAVTLIILVLSLIKFYMIKDNNHSQQ